MAEEREAADAAEIVGQNAADDAENQENREQPAENAEGSGDAAGAAGEGGAADPEKLKPSTPKWMKDRIDRATRQRGDAERAAAAERERADKATQDNARLRAILEAEGRADPGAEGQRTRVPAQADTTAADIERRAAEIAESRVRQQQIASDSARVMSAGAKEYGSDKWEEARKDFVGNFGDELQARPEFFDALFGVENGHKVFYDLANDPDEAHRILSLSPSRMGIEIARLADKAAPARRVSQAAPPINPLSGSARVSRSVLDGDISMDDFIAQREAQIAARNGR